MIRRLYIDNYRSLVNFELRLGPVNLLMGANGSGKSSVFAALAGLRRIVHDGERAGDVFPAASHTRWQTRATQVFEMELDLAGESFRYRLQVAHLDGRIAIEQEELAVDGAFVYSRVRDTVDLVGDRRAASGAMLVDVERSALSLLASRAGHERIRAFVARIAGTHVLAMQPAAMKGWSEDEAAAPALDLANFASWYRHLAQDRGPEMNEAQAALRDVLAGFYGLRLRESGHHEAGRKLVSEWKLGDGKRITFDFDELSDGQRALIGLYTLLYAGGDDAVTICVDEPDNFVALPEIQPWLGALSERRTLQTLMISHHPEILNMHARDDGIVFRRDDGGPTRVERFAAEPGETLTPAELIARGWYRGAD